MDPTRAVVSTVELELRGRLAFLKRARLVPDQGVSPLGSEAALM